MKKKNLATLLYEELRDAEVFLDERQQAHVVLREPDRTRHLPLRGAPFLRWLSRFALALTGEVPSDTPLKAVARMLAAQAEEAPRVTLWNRVARAEDGAIWLDLCDPQGRAVRVTAAGWEVRPAPPLFHRYSHQLPLPEPARGGDLRRLCGFLNLRGAADQVLFLGSLVASLVPDIPQPILILHGPQGAAKTTAARLRRGLVDPSAVKTVMVRHELGELVQALDHHYMPILDNLTCLSVWQEQVLCQATTGAAFTKRRLFTDQEDVLMAFHRPVVLTGISLPSAAPDLLDRALLISLERIDPTERRDEATMWRAFEAERPMMLGGLLGALSAAMGSQGELAFTGLPRMADFTRWGVAAAMALGYDGDGFLAALSDNVVRQGEEVLEDDPLAAAVRALVARDGLVAASATRLLVLLSECAGPVGLPRRPAELGRRLTVLRAPLADVGILIKSARSNGGSRERVWILADQARADG